MDLSAVFILPLPISLGASGWSDMQSFARNFVSAVNLGSNLTRYVYMEHKVLGSRNMHLPRNESSAREKQAKTSCDKPQAKTSSVFFSPTPTCAP